jgi:hypothetical protein
MISSARQGLFAGGAILCCCSLLCLAACGSDNGNPGDWAARARTLSDAGGGNNGIDGAATPDLSEQCNGLDDNGDGQVDEGCNCQPGAAQGCFLGSASTRGNGICKDGTQLCSGSGEFGAWGVCQGSVTPSTESLERCSDGLDNDCDGLVDCADPQCATSAACPNGGGLQCGNGTVEAGETCDPPSSCPRSCDDGDACTQDTLTGSAASCTATCTHQPIVSCQGGDGCCAAGCTRGNDSDCFDPGCAPSAKIAFVTCDPSKAILPGALTIDIKNCDAVEAAVAAAQHPLAGYDTIAYFGPVFSTPWAAAGEPGTALATVLQQLDQGAKILLFPSFDASSTQILNTNAVLGLDPYWTELVQITPAHTVVAEQNPLTAAFDPSAYPTLGALPVSDARGQWCGDLMYANVLGWQQADSGHFHGYRMDDATHKGLLVYMGLLYAGGYSTPYLPFGSSPAPIDLSDAFLAAHFALAWDPSDGSSAACGLTCSTPLGQASLAKPVIYLYPPVQQEVIVKLDLDGKLQTTYPAYDSTIGGWDVVAQPDGTLTNVADGLEYSYLFWDGTSPHFHADFTSGFVVAGQDTAAFLQKTLAAMGLTPKEYNEFIVYWLPRMQQNPFNLIHFAGDEYTSVAKLSTTPPADAMLRVFMVFTRLAQPITVPAQPIAAFTRHGFTVVEWGGTEIGAQP